jgi:hypothetical protein
MTENLRPTERVNYGINLAGWAVKRALESTESEAVASHLKNAQQELQLASEQFGNVVAGLTEEERPRQDVLDEIKKCLRETREF